MRTADLRLGNFIQDQFGDVIIVDGLDDMDVFSSDCGDIPIHTVQPIPLTEQWLLDFGFEETIEESFIKELYGATLIIFIINGVAELIYKHYSSHSENEIDTVNAVCLLSVEYVHQLQNLYFALMQEEIKLKDK